MTKKKFPSDFNVHFFWYESNNFKKKNVLLGEKNFDEEMLEIFFVNYCFAGGLAQKNWPHFSHFKSTISQKLNIGKLFFFSFLSIHS